MDYRNREHGSLSDPYTAQEIYLSEPAGADFPPHSNQQHPKTIGRGAEHVNTYIGSRATTWPITIKSNLTLAGFHSRKKYLEDLVKINRSPGEQSLVVEYTGANEYVPSYLDVRTEGFDLTRIGYSGQGLWRALAEQPQWYEQQDRYAALTRFSELEVSYILGWLNDGTGFSNLGNTGTGAVYALAIAANGDVYVGGDFVNWDGIANADRFVRYNRAAGTWTAPFVGANGAVSKIIIIDDGDLIIVGSFTSIGGGAHNYAVRWDGSTLSDFGTGFDDGVEAVAFDYKRGVIYFGGPFTTADGVTVNGIARYTLATGLFTAMGGTPGVADSGLAFVRAIYVEPASGDVFIGGNFDTAGGVTVNNIARWDFVDEDWNTVGKTGDPGVNDIVNSLTADPTGMLYLGGLFTENTPGVVLNYIAKTKIGSVSIDPVGSGVNAEVNFVYWDNVLNKLLLSGQFTLPLFSQNLNLDRVGYWNGTTFESLGLDFPGTPTVYAFARHANGDYHFGFTTTGTMIVPSATNNVANGGTDLAYPVIVLDASADPVGTDYAALTTLGNRSLGVQVNFNDLRILAGSIVVVDFNPGAQRVYRIVGQNKVDLTSGTFRRDSAPSSFVLTPGLNQILVACPDVVGTPDIDVYLLHRRRHWSLSGTAT